MLSFGPQHPSTHGVPRLIAILYGEIIQWITPEIGLLHRGTEKLIDLHYYNSSISYFDRFDHAPTTTQELLFIHALERLIGWYSNIYDSSQRSIFMEFYRIPNHCSAITTHAIDIGTFTTTLWAFEEREKLINFSEEIPGNRFHAAFLLIGRLRYDVSLRRIDCRIYWMMCFNRKLKEVFTILPKSELRVSRQYEIGIIERTYCLYFGFPGLLSRASNILPDARLMGYEFYQCLDYSLFLGSKADCPDRYLSRFNEMIESCRIIRLILYLRSYEVMYYSCYSVQIGIHC
jgi:NADH:ubiquinone oxidoreductase subunit D